ncbi:translation elongation factor Ts [candidate division WWE3 bacterium RBG_19FT_COMBO_34_6]|uniref:Elongation factor Ts n=1 Tax=candidate division WWE3 bacterium RBG_19FT_COMBO_34_6 TaxID=1802612 RepID=A0A1F4UMV8_UNCKA|nr:MAG: translation elongation factor Ts [candidate division WWE3 bacterium RBG_19FT_COMBO_34_6]
MQQDIKKIKLLRDETGAGVLEVKQALENSNGDVNKAKEELMAKVSSKAAKKSGRVAGDGSIFSYIHNNGKVGSLLHLACETDFVAKTDDFKFILKEIAMQVCTEDYKNVEELLKAEYMRDPQKTINDLINEKVAKLGEKIEIKKFVKFSVIE